MLGLATGSRACRVQWAAVVLSAILFATTAAAHQRTFHFEIKQQPLSQALRHYGQICGQDLIFTEDVLSGAGTASLQGDFSAQEALDRLLGGTNLVAVRSPSGAVMIRKLTSSDTSNLSAMPADVRRVAFAGPESLESESAGHSTSFASIPRHTAPNTAEPSGVIRSTTCTGGVNGAIGGCGASSGLVGGGRDTVGLT